MKQSLIADLGSFQKSICKCMLRCGFRLELGLLKLCEERMFSVLFQSCSLVPLSTAYFNRYDTNISNLQ